MRKNAPFIPPLYTPPKRKSKKLLLIVVMGLLLLGGILVASRIDITQPLIFEEQAGRELIVAELTLGALLTPEEARTKNPKLRQAQSYTTREPLALRITTDPSVTEPFFVSVRLLKKNGQVLELNPTSVSFQPGTSAYCCWIVEEPGEYTWQVFRPEKVITSLPIRIIPASQAPPPLL